MRAVLVLLLVAVLAGCAGGTDGGSPPSDDEVTQAPELAGAWSGDFRTELPNGWALEGCEGDAPLICVRDGERLLGDLALHRYALEAEETGSPRDIAEARARDFLGSFAEDRAAGCAGYIFQPDVPHGLTVGGVEGVRASFTLIDGQGAVVERVIAHFAVRDGELWLVQTDAYAEQGGCLPPSETDASFTPDTLAELEQWLDDIVATTPLPT